MIIHDQKKAMQSIMARRQGLDQRVASAPLRQEVSMTEPGQIDGRHAAASDMLAAINDHSPQKLMESLANFHEMHLLHQERMQSE